MAGSTFTLYLLHVPIIVLVRAAAPVAHTSRLYDLCLFAVPLATAFGVAAVTERRKDVWRRFFDSYDILLCPIMPTVAFAHDTTGDEFGHIAQFKRTTLIDGVPRPYLDGWQWPGRATGANRPATAVPTGRRIDGLPMGLQAIGPYLEDRTTLRFAQLVEQELGGFSAPPPLA